MSFLAYPFTSSSSCILLTPAEMANSIQWVTELFLDSEYLSETEARDDPRVDFLPQLMTSKFKWNYSRAHVTCLNGHLTAMEHNRLCPSVLTPQKELLHAKGSLLVGTKDQGLLQECMH